MILQTLIEKKLALTGIEIVTKKLGYSAEFEDKVSARITDIINSHSLALNQSSFDLQSSTPEFLKKLCRILKIPELLSNTIISETVEYPFQKKKTFKPSIFIETNFVRKSEPIFALSALEGTRYIAVAAELSYMPLDMILEHVQNVVKSHYQKGKPLIWGEIEHYVFHYDEDTVIILSPEGEVIGDCSYYIKSITKVKI